MISARQSRTRASRHQPHTGPSGEKDALVKAIIDLMVADDAALTEGDAPRAWPGSEAYSAQTGTPLARVQDAAADASRFKRLISDVPAYRMRLIVAGDEALQRARRNEDDYAIAKLIEPLAKVAGVVGTGGSNTQVNILNAPSAAPPLGLLEAIYAALPNESRLIMVDVVERYEQRALPMGGAITVEPVRELKRGEEPQKDGE